MVEADQSYHPQLSEQSRTQIVRAIIAVALYEGEEGDQAQHSARGPDQVVQGPGEEIERMAKAMVMERRDEFLAKAKASSFVQDEIQRLQATSITRRGKSG
jgi:hypothetical protein